MPTTYERLAFMSFRIGCFLKIDCPRWPLGLLCPQLLARRGGSPVPATHASADPSITNQPLSWGGRPEGGGLSTVSPKRQEENRKTLRRLSIHRGLFLVVFISHLKFRNKSNFLSFRCVSFIFVTCVQGSIEMLVGSGCMIPNVTEGG